MIWNVVVFREDNEESISPLRPLKTRYKYLPLRLFGLPFTFEDEEATKIKKKFGTVLNTIMTIINSIAIEFGILFQDWVGIQLYWLACWHLSISSSRIFSFLLSRINLTLTWLTHSIHMAWILGTSQPRSFCFILEVLSRQHTYSSSRIRDQR